MSQKPTIPKGMRDFGPIQMAKRNIIFNAIKNVFQKYGFMPLETPTMENLSTLTGKYGDEGDQLLFKVLNSGDYLSKASETDFKDGSKTLLKKISEKGLKYDLTVPFARYVVMNRHELAFPFKRYQIQPVWRADRPQRGRYREFYQCDADVVGTNSLICEAEIILMVNEVFEKLGIKDFVIKINHRKILTGFTEVIGAEGKESDFCVAIDKLDKIGKDKVLDELRSKDFSDQAIKKVTPLLELEGGINSKTEKLRELLSSSESGVKGLEELSSVFELVESMGLKSSNVELDTTLARGLSYYTGAIFEVKVNNVSIGSVSGGGRYDDLTGVFGMPDMSGVGFSFGVDRLYDVMEELGIFAEDNLISTQLLIVHFDQSSLQYALGVAGSLRSEGINTEVFPDQVKIKKQFNYADKKNIPWVLIIGSDEITTGKLTLRNMKSGEESKLPINEVIQKLTIS